ncbi:MAG: hypothetical protein WCT24_03755 [Patescibacteria group bacterium]
MKTLFILIALFLSWSAIGAPCSTTTTTTTTCTATAPEREPVAQAAFRILTNLQVEVAKLKARPAGSVTQSQIKAVEAQIAELKSGLDEMGPRFQSMTLDIDALESDLGALSIRVTQLETDVQTLDDRADKTEARVAEVEDDVGDLMNWGETVVAPALKADRDAIESLQAERVYLGPELGVFVQAIAPIEPVLPDPMVVGVRGGFMIGVENQHMNRWVSIYGLVASQYSLGAGLDLAVAWKVRGTNGLVQIGFAAGPQFHSYGGLRTNPVNAFGGAIGPVLVVNIGAGGNAAGRLVVGGNFAFRHNWWMCQDEYGQEYRAGGDSDALGVSATFQFGGGN